MSSLDAESRAEARMEEWQAIQAIYPEYVPTEQPKTAELFVLQVPVQLSEPLPVHIVSESKPDTGQDIVILSHFPSISLNLALPPTYPSQPPTIHSLQPLHAWLPPPLIEHLRRILVDMWDHDCILGTWLEHLQNGDQLLSSLNLLRTDAKFVRLPNSSPHLLSPLLVAHNASMLEMNFQAATHTCPICLTRLLGTQCIALKPCSHVACRSCLKEFWGSCIAEGNIARVGCPEQTCVKDARLATAADVKAIVSAKELERWEWLLHKREIEKDPTITHCPRLSCQLPVRPPPPEADAQQSGWARFRSCDCGFSFCVSCRHSWHGVHTPCYLLNTNNVVYEYLKHPEGSEERIELERIYGRGNILRAITSKLAMDEDSSHRWIGTRTMACPHCKVRVEKSEGCNRMICSQCGKCFEWLLD